MSSLVRQEKFAAGIDGADFVQTMALVLAGFPTIKTLNRRG